MRDGLRVNCGSGQRPFGAGWVNVDIQERWRKPALDAGGEFILADMGDMPLEDGCAEVVVSHHTLEHYGCGEGKSFIREAHRVLRSGGSLIVTVPDMRALAEAWLAGRIDNYIFLVNTYGAYMGDEADRHKWGYTRKSLQDELTGTAEWLMVFSFDWREIPGASIAHDWWILGMEAVK